MRRLQEFLAMYPVDMLTDDTEEVSLSRASSVLVTMVKYSYNYWH